MADPLSISSGIAGILSLAGLVLSQCYQYGCNVAGAPEEAQKLISEVTNLSGILVGIQAMVARCGVVSVQLEEHASQCETLLKTLSSRLQSHSPEIGNSKRKRIFNRAMWPLRRGETEQMIGAVDRQKVTLSLMLDSMSMTLVAQQSTTLESVAHSVGGLTAAVAMQQQQRLLAWLSDHDYEAQYQRACQLHCPDTCKWLLDHPELKKWSESRSSLIWLHGVAGSGKTIATTHLIQHFLSNMKVDAGMLGYFYYDASTIQTMEPEVFFGAILKQFCLQLPEVPPAIVKTYEFASVRSSPPRRATAEQMTGWLSEILESDSSNATIIIDGLDESSHYRSVCRFLSGVVSAGRHPVKVFVSSRPEVELRRWFINFRQLAMPEKSIEEDMGIYISSRIKNHPRLQRVNKSLKEHIEFVLRRDSNGMFRWVQCQLDEISKLRTDGALKRALQQLPASLEGSYERVLNKIDPADEVYAHQALLWSAHVTTPLFLDELADAVTFNPEMCLIDPDAKLNQTTDVLEICGSLLAYNETSGEVRIAHHSVREYLTSRLGPDSPFAIPGPESHYHLARCCLSYLLLRDIDSGPLPKAELERTLKEFPLLRYAAQNWTTHLHMFNSEAALLPLILQLLTPRATSRFQFWLQVVLYASKHGYVDHVTGLANAQPLYYAASYGLVETVRSLIAAGAELNDSAGRYGGTALHAACWRDKADIARALLEAGADATIRDHHGETPADLASMISNDAMYHMLLPYEKINPEELASRRKESRLQGVRGYTGHQKRPVPWR